MISTKVIFNPSDSSVLSEMAGMCADHVDKEFWLQSWGHFCFNFTWRHISELFHLGAYHFCCWAKRYPCQLPNKNTLPYLLIQGDSVYCLPKSSCRSSKLLPMMENEMIPKSTQPHCIICHWKFQVHETKKNHLKANVRCRISEFRIPCWVLHCSISLPRWIPS